MSLHSPSAGAGPAANVDFQEVQQEPRFQELRKRHRSFVFPLAVAFLLWYFLYVLLADYAHEFMSIKVFGSINLGLIFGLLQFVTTFGITTWYVSYSNRKLDPVATEIREEIESGEHTHRGHASEAGHASEVDGRDGQEHRSAEGGKP